ncbi:hypothetical protein G7K_1064-t1 [Saitoella complicata NRRL Y-17804]|uniref:Uncharacterized protein n=1 Tax=Saitoella complicata (strain BCRC 22490 / CBS 7301 / JCM 7358 / NBRC 10748 / NRRL Y-17804) TaxID=698492 RepID=A0A0E9NAV2_SAICN|nr:hypothetical protein G7K_1064-t1 [Saitoella complicata NRRL Y-17804]
MVQAAPNSTAKRGGAHLGLDTSSIKQTVRACLWAINGIHPPRNPALSSPIERGCVWAAAPVQQAPQGKRYTPVGLAERSSSIHCSERIHELTVALLPHLQR